MLGVLISVGLSVAAFAILLGCARNRSRDYESIEAAEVNPDLAAGETLLREALLADVLHE